MVPENLDEPQEACDAKGTLEPASSNLPRSQTDRRKEAQERNPQMSNRTLFIALHRSPFRLW